MTPSEPTTNDLEPIEHVPENVVIHDRGSARGPSTRRPWVLLSSSDGAETALPPSPHWWFVSFPQDES
jgi:hypothetical protein